MDDQEIWIKKQQQRFGRRPIVLPAIQDGRNYITPKDISACIEVNEDINELRRDFLMILANWTGYGIEDKKTCAFVLTESEE